jgi:hypothetical protein
MDVYSDSHREPLNVLWAIGRIGLTVMDVEADGTYGAVL